MEVQLTQKYTQDLLALKSEVCRRFDHYIKILPERWGQLGITDRNEKAIDYWSSFMRGLFDNQIESEVRFCDKIEEEVRGFRRQAEKMMAILRLDQESLPWYHQIDLDSDLDLGHLSKVFPDKGLMEKYEMMKGQIGKLEKVRKKRLEDYGALQLESRQLLSILGMGERPEMWFVNDVDEDVNCGDYWGFWL